MDFFLGITVFFLGACWGSFLYVVCYRLPLNRTFIRGRSACPACAKQLALWEVIPIVSYLILRGKCRHCHAAISWHYLGMEVLTGILFLTGWMLYGCCWELALYLIEITALLLIFWIDLYTGWVYEIIVVPAIVVVFAIQLVLGHSPLVYVIGVLLGMLVFILQYLVSRGSWVGKGDIRIGALMGAILGWKVLIIGLGIAYIFGGIVALGLLLSRKKSRGDSVPFGPFLVVGTLIAMLWGQIIMDWYLGLIGYPIVL